MNVTQYIYLLAFIIFASCGFDDPSQVLSPQEQTQNPYINVDERLVSHFQEFERVAAARGIYIDLRDLGITGVIDQIDETGVLGTCQYGLHIHHVTVDENFWRRASNISKEFVVFHELGHCVLARDHSESAFANGICKSIMRSGLGDCRDAYISANRNYYLNELFSFGNKL